MSEPKNIQTAILALAGLTGAYYGTKGTLGMVLRFTEARIGMCYKDHTFIKKVPIQIYYILNFTIGCENFPIFLFISVIRVLLIHVHLIFK